MTRTNDWTGSGKIGYPTLVLGLWFSALGASALEATNLLKNPGFDDKEGGGWQFHATSPHYHGRIELGKGQEATFAYLISFGNPATKRKYGCIAGGHAGISQTATIKGKGRHVLRFSMKPGGTTNLVEHLVVQALIGDHVAWECKHATGGSSKPVWTDGRIISTPAWKKVEVDVTSFLAGR